MVSDEVNEMEEAETPDGGDEVNAMFAGKGKLPEDVAAETQVKRGRKIAITIFNQEGPTGDKPVFVACNGFGMSIPRNQKVEVPEGIFGALKDAVETQYYRETDDEGKQFGPIKSKGVPRFPFTVHLK